MDIPGITFLKDHERLVIVVILALFGVFGFYKVQSMLQDYHTAKETQLEQQLAATQTQTKVAQDAAVAAQAQVVAAQQAAAQDKAAAAAIISAISSQNAQLTKNIIDRDKATQTQQGKDLQATIPELGERFVQLVPAVQSSDIKVAADNKTVTIGQDTAQKTVAQLELIPQLQEDKKDLQTQVTNGQSEVGALQKALNSMSTLVDTETKLVASQETVNGLLQKQIGQSDGVWQQKLDVEKGKTRKAYLKGFGIGAVVGFIGGLLVHGV